MNQRLDTRYTTAWRPCTHKIVLSIWKPQKVFQVHSATFQKITKSSLLAFFEFILTRRTVQRLISLSAISKLNFVKSWLGPAIFSAGSSMLTNIRAAALRGNDLKRSCQLWRNCESLLKLFAVKKGSMRKCENVRRRHSLSDSTKVWTKVQTRCMGFKDDSETKSSSLDKEPQSVF